MAKFNAKRTTQAAKTKTVNRAGGIAYKESPKLALVSQMLTSFVKDQFYRSADEGINDLRALIQQVDPLFAAKAAVFARREFGMRSISHVAAVEIAKAVKGEEWTRRFFENIVRRPDDMLEIMSLYMQEYATKKDGKFRSLPNSMKKGFRSVLENMNEYSLSKYKGDRRDLSMIDLVRLTHPKRTAAIDALYKGTLKPAETWEVGLTQAGQNAESEEEKSDLKNAAWKSLISNGKLKYFALIRNLRNILEQAPDQVDAVCRMLTDKKAVKESLLFPFRFTTAMAEIEKLPASDVRRKVQVDLEKALELSFDNIPEFDGNTLVVVDFSGSMGNGFQSNRGIGSLFAIAMAKKNLCDFMIFGSEAAYLDYDPTRSIGSLMGWIDKLNGYGREEARYNVGHGTNFNAIFQKANKKYDRILIFSDMQGWIGGGAPEASFKAYCKHHDADPHLYSINLAGYGDAMFSENKIYALAGFSDKIFDIMKLLEQDRQALIHTIEQYKAF